MSLRTLHITTGLETGGAELMLARLASTLPGTSAVVQLRSGGGARQILVERGVQTIDLGARSALSLPRVTRELVSIVHRWQPTLIQSWMYHANVVASVVGLTPGIDVPIVWNVRQTFSGYDRERTSTAWLIWLSRYFSRQPEAIIYNSEVARISHEDIGYDRGRSVLISNGFDLSRYFPDRKKRFKTRTDFGVGEDTFVIGFAARFHPMKDHQLFCRAASMLVGKVRSVKFVLAGKGITRENQQLIDLLVTYGIDTHTVLLGEYHEMPSFFNACDVISVSSRWGEAFPNVLGEAMACGIPCVTTDVGDSRAVVGKEGIVIRPGDHEALLAAWITLHSCGAVRRQEIGVRLRERVVAQYDLQAIGKRYAALYEQISQKGEVLKNRPRSNERSNEKASHIPLGKL